MSFKPTLVVYTTNTFLQAKCSVFILKPSLVLWLFYRISDLPFFFLPSYYFIWETFIRKKIFSPQLVMKKENKCLNVRNVGLNTRYFMTAMNCWLTPLWRIGMHYGRGLSTSTTGQEKIPFLGPVVKKRLFLSVSQACILWSVHILFFDFDLVNWMVPSRYTVQRSSRHYD